VDRATNVRTGTGVGAGSSRLYSVKSHVSQGT
jgi:hypothetical protein